ncbi:S66 peptidase family protein [Clostridium hydrogeniformans]|uniref:S66 peptidase family protein n=1 Tax=Clostridium hydrogeniformans TaxID=349933 RepID=UPI0004802D98|nr:LD-carboxypeptidase [Clostridium hydrogeniformans]
MIPKRIKLGDTIGILAPASAEDSIKIDEKLNSLEKLGFKIKKASHIYDKYGYLAGRDEDRASDFMDMFLDKDVNMIMCLRGGYGSMRMLPLIDFNKLKSCNKIFIGYSDITPILNTLYSKLGLVSFHGPMATTDLTDTFTLESLFNTLIHGVGSYDICNPSHIPLYSYGSSNTEGILVGGNLSLICSTLGTPYEIDTTNKILFMEEVSEDIYIIDRMLCQLKLSGKLNKCRGFILGQFKDCIPSKEASFQLDEIFYHHIFSLNKPVLWNFMSGHDNPKLTLPIGAKVRLDITGKKISVLHGVVK